MSRNYDNWERLVAAVFKKEQLWQLFHEQSRSPSISSESSSGFSFSFGLNSSLDENELPFTFSSPKWSAPNQRKDDNCSNTAAVTPSILVKDQSPVENHLSRNKIVTFTAAPTPTIPVKDQSPVENHLSPNKNVTFTPHKKRNLKIQVPKVGTLHHGDFRSPTENLEYGPNISPRMRSPISSSRVHPRAGGGHYESNANWPDDAKQQSHPLPLPPGAISNSPPVSRPNSAATSPSTPLRSPDRSEKVKSPNTRWKKGKLIGRGPLGDVYVGFNSEKGEMCAMKEVTLLSGDVKSRAKMMEKEIALLSNLKHPNIVQYYGSETVGDNLYIYFEYVSGGSIYKILQEYGKLGESAIRSYTQQILSGLEYLHSKRIAHVDIKGANILVDPNGGVKLSNFGGKHIAGQYDSSLPMDSPYWMAPEAIMNPNVRNLAIDIWSLGCTVVEMAASKPPISQYAEVVAMFKIANHKELPTIPDHLSEEGKDFVRHCLQWNPQHRATASQLLEHPFVRSSSPLGKHILVSTSSGHHAVTNAVKSEGTTDHARSMHQLDSGRLAMRSPRASISNFQPSDIYAPRNISTPVSPVGSPLRHPRLPQHLNQLLSPPPKSSPRAASSSVEICAVPYQHLNQSMFPRETFSNLPKHSPSNMNTPSYWDPNILQRVQHSDHDFQELPSSSDNVFLRKQNLKAANGQLYEQSVLADRVFQQLHRAPVKLNPFLDRNPSSILTSHRMAG